MGLHITDLLSEADVRTNVPASCRRDALAGLADHAASRLGLDKVGLLGDLTDRERLGSTGIGRGVAIPHAKADVPSVTGAFFQLAKPVDFDAIDDLPVDLMFLLIAPRGDDAGHLKALSRVARALRGDAIQRALRAARTPEALHRIITARDEAAAA